MKGGSKVVVEQHRHAGVFIARGKEDALVTRNMVPGESVYGEKRISVEQVRHVAARGACMLACKCKYAASGRLGFCLLAAVHKHMRICMHACMAPVPVRRVPLAHMCPLPRF